ncbi:MAG TPA: TIR domain-containing protein [Sphingomicrobium sp.]|jgi:Predicted integral membrane protein|nr:TIR domain-containing protein [Sphingomicrobium sp.]
MTSSAADVFVSYKAEDRRRVEPLVAALEAEGFSVWWDAHIGGGTHWREDIQDHLDAAKCVMVAWTKRSVGHDGDFVRDEATRARKRGTYLPVRLEAVEPPLGFGEVQALSLHGWKGDRTDPRFRAVADAVRSRITGKDVAHDPAHFAEPRVSRRAVVAGGAGVAAVAVAGAGGWLLLKPSAANAKRIAVLPFANLSNDPEQAYFSEGVAEELRTALSRIGMQVIGRASSDAVKDLDTEAAASKLGVANILTGSVRRSPDTIRVNAQLVSGSDGVERWAQTYDRAPGDAIKIQADIAANVAQALSIALGQAGRAALTLGGTADSVAQDFILQSRKLTNEASGAEAIGKSIALANEAIARDPGYATAYVEKADALARLAQNYPSTPAEAANQLAEGDAAARRAIALAPRLGSAYAALANIEGSRLQFANVLPQIKQALALSPEDPAVLAESAFDLTYFGDATEALRVADRFIALDPLNARAYDRKSRALTVLRRYPQAIEVGRRGLQLAPNRFNIHILIGDSLTLSGQYAAARAEYQAMPADDVFRLTGEAIVAARTGDATAAERTMARLKQLYGVNPSYQYSQINVQLGNVDGAFAELDNAIQVKDAGLTSLKTDPFLDPIRNDRRYAALLKRLNFP